MTFYDSDTEQFFDFSYFKNDGVNVKIKVTQIGVPGSWWIFATVDKENKINWDSSLKGNDGLFTDKAKDYINRVTKLQVFA
jgi:hypothetical protein